MKVRHNRHAYDIKHKDREVYQVELHEHVSTEEFKLECEKSPECIDIQLQNIQDNSQLRILMNHSVVYRNEWPQRHVPEQVLSCLNFVECNECPRLHQDRKEYIVVECNASKNSNTPLRNEHK